MMTRLHAPMKWWPPAFLLVTLTSFSGAAPVSDTASDVGRSIAKTADQAWQAAVQRGDPRNLSLDEIIAWLIIGAMVGACAAIVATRRRGGFGTGLNLLLGLLGAFVGGVIVDTFNLNFGWGAVVIGYEETVAAFVCALGFVVCAKMLRAWRSRTTSDTVNR